jgi:transposase
MRRILSTVDFAAGCCVKSADGSGRLMVYSRALKFTKLSKPSLNRIASVIRISATFIAREYRRRHNVLGALNFISKKMEFVANNEYITSVQVVELMEKIAKKYCGRLIVLVLDNARYQRCKLVEEKAGLLGIQLEFLPPYSPNLNLVERFWKFVKTNVLNASSLNTFGLFCKIIDEFVAYAYIKHKPKMDSLITDNFQLFDSIVVNSIRSFH